MVFVTEIVYRMFLVLVASFIGGLGGKTVIVVLTLSIRPYHSDYIPEVGVLCIPELLVSLFFFAGEFLLV